MGKNVSCYFNDELLELFESYCSRTGKNKSEVIKELVSDLKNYSVMRGWKPSSKVKLDISRIQLSFIEY